MRWAMTLAVGVSLLWGCQSLDGSPGSGGGARLDDSLTSTSGRAEIGAFLDRGFAGARLRCDDYFRQMARRRLRTPDRRLLFGAETIGVVRSLTFKALDAHAGEASEIDGVGEATRHLLDHQAICTEANILALVRAAIVRGSDAAVEVVHGGGAE